MKKILLFSLLFLLFCNTNAQTGEFNIIATYNQTAIGSGSNTFSTVAVDKGGNVWVGYNAANTSLSGLFMMNTAHSWSSQSFMVNHSIHRITVDTAGKIWVASSGSSGTNAQTGGLFIFNQGSIGSYNRFSCCVPVQISSRYSYDVLPLGNGTAYSLTGNTFNVAASEAKSGGIDFVNNSTQAVSNIAYGGNYYDFTNANYINPYYSFPSGAIHNGDLWVTRFVYPVSGAGYALLESYHLGSGNPNRTFNQTSPYVPLSGSSTNPYVRKMFSDSRGNLWFGVQESNFTSNCIFRFNSSNSFDTLVIGHPIKALFQANSSVFVYAINEAPDKSIWFGTSLGLISFKGTNMQDSTAWHRYTTADGLPSSSINDIAFDPNGNMWLATAAGIVEVQLKKTDWLGFYNTILGNPSFNSAPFLLDSADVQARPFKICADGSSATSFSFKCDTCNLSHLRYRLTRSHLYDYDKSLSGYFTNAVISAGDTLLKTTYTHPSRLNLLASNISGLKVDDTLEVIDTVANKTVFKNPIEIYRAPIVFVHGLTADSSTFRPMSDFLLQTSLYPRLPNLPRESILFNRVNYKSRNVAALNLNKKVVPEAIDTLFKSARKNGYSSGKVVLIGHSMGGLLSRIYLENLWGDLKYRNDIEKIITISTPHYGSEVCNYLVAHPTLQGVFLSLTALGQLVNSSTGAIPDMRVDAPTIRNLNLPPYNLSRVPSTTIGTDAAGDPSFFDISLGALLSPAINHLNIYHGDTSDLVVPLTSQKCKLQLNPTVLHQVHMGAGANSAVEIRVSGLLDDNPLDPGSFNLGFPEGELIAMPAPRNQNQIARSNSGDSIKIISPTAGQIYNPGDTVSVHIYYSGHINTMALFSIGGGMTPIVIDTSAVNQINFQLPLTALGLINLTLLGGDTTDWFVTDTTHIFVGAAIAPDSIINNPRTGSVALGLTQTIDVEGYFSMNPASSVPLSGMPNLLLHYDTSFLIDLGNYVYKAKKLGNTVIYSSYLGSQDSTMLTIYDDPSALISAFTYSSSAPCQGGSVIFTDQSQGLITGYNWKFPGGNPSSSQQANPVVTYTNQGTYSVKLVTTFVNGIDSTTFDSLIIVAAPPVQPIVQRTGNELFIAQASGTVDQWYYSSDSVQFNLLPDNTDSLNLQRDGYYYAIVTDISGCHNSSVVHYFNIAGIDKLTNNYRIKVFPNPTSGAISVNTYISIESTCIISIYDILGQIVYHSTEKLGAGAKKLSIPLNNVPTGAYLIEIKIGEELWTDKILKY